MIIRQMNKPYLVNGTRNEALNIGIVPKDFGESGTEGWSSLNSRETKLADVL